MACTSLRSSGFARQAIISSAACFSIVADPEAGEVEGRYTKAYEETMNPFSDFRSREKEARRQQMNVLDRIMFEFGQFISGSQ